MVGRHHLTQHIVVTLSTGLHHVHGDLVHVWRAAMDPRDGALRDAHRLLAHVHVVVGDTEGSRNALKRSGLPVSQGGGDQRRGERSLSHVVSCRFTTQAESIQPPSRQSDTYR